MLTLTEPTRLVAAAKERELPDQKQAVRSALISPRNGIQQVISPGLQQP
jgi:hypothetical protein